jgi:hypothetical protein
MAAVVSPQRMRRLGEMTGIAWLGSVSGNYALCYSEDGRLVAPLDPDDADEIGEMISRLFERHATILIMR